MKRNTVFSILVVSAGIVAGIICLGNRGSTRVPIARQTMPAAVPSLAVSNEPMTRAQLAVSNSQISPPASSVRTVKSNVADSPIKEDASADQPLVINGYVVRDPVARAALSYVGSDPDADAYWIDAINDPNLPAEERKDLIEDLNEDGLANPKLAAPQDLPLIANRIQLIEEMAPLAMDQANADAFAEAYKDLVNLYNGLPAD